MRTRAACALAAFATLAIGLAGCGRSKPEGKDRGMTLERLETEDTTGLSSGRPLLQKLDVARDEAGAIRARGRIRLPDGARLDLTIFPARGRDALARTQFEVRGGAFESVPLLSQGAALPPGTYRFEVVCYFDPVLQPAEVMRATDGGHSLRGPGMTRGHNGLAAFLFTREARL